MGNTKIGPLEGIRVIEMGSLIAGPYAGAVLAQFGAEVIRLSPLIGDPLRKWRKMDGDTSLWWYSQSRNKKSLALNLKDPDAQGVLRDLVREADVLVENFRHGTLEVEPWLGCPLSNQFEASDAPRIRLRSVGSFRG